MDNWEEKMDAIIASKRILDKLNVIDISFTGGQLLEVYVAISKEERSSGLQSIPYLDVDGMMFFYDKPSFNPFTMKDVGFDLDIGWYDIGGVCIKRGTYNSGLDAPIFSPKPYSYVIETLAGKLPASNLKVANV
jgi:uncharacterized membrane protein (UPF0127 family)